MKIYKFLHYEITSDQIFNYVITVILLVTSKYFCKWSYLTCKKYWPTPTVADAAEKGQFGFQDPASPTVEGMIIFNDFLTLLLLIIAIFVCWILLKLITTYTKNNNIQKFTHSSLLEIIWTLIPAFLLLIIAVPSFSLLYALDEIINPLVTLKIVGHQWYWSYEYSDLMIDSTSINFDSYMISTNDLTYGSFRLLEVDNRVVLPINTHIRLLVTAADVLHSWAIPSFGIKVDACPGRLSQASLFIKREGTFYGQCSEICGINHGFMPIVIRSVSLNVYTNWIISKLIDEID
jgi:cytochrome c oxidase subunit 2